MHCENPNGCSTPRVGGVCAMRRRHRDLASHNPICAKVRELRDALDTSASTRSDTSVARNAPLVTRRRCTVDRRFASPETKKAADVRGLR
jgi:hypothetical protein